MELLHAVFFDLDDTLINSTAATTAALIAIQPLLPPRSLLELAQLLKDAYQQLWGYGTPHYNTLKTLSTPDLRRQLTQRALELLDITDYQQVEAIVAVYEATENAALQPVAGARELLALLKPHVRLGIITNGPSLIQREKLSQVGLADQFDIVVADADFGAPKPDPALFAYAAASLGIRSRKLVFVGDSLEADVAGANAAGWISVLVGAHAPEANFCINCLEDLLALPPFLPLRLSPPSSN